MAHCTVASFRPGRQGLGFGQFQYVQMLCRCWTSKKRCYCYVGFFFLCTWFLNNKQGSLFYHHHGLLYLYKSFNHLNLFFPQSILDQNIIIPMNLLCMISHTDRIGNIICFSSWKIVFIIYFSWTLYVVVDVLFN